MRLRFSSLQARRMSAAGLSACSPEVFNVALLADMLRPCAEPYHAHACLRMEEDFKQDSRRVSHQSALLGPVPGSKFKAQSLRNIRGMVRGAEQHLCCDGRHGSSVQGTRVVPLRTPNACSQ